MSNWTNKVYQPVGFVLLGVMVGVGLTLVIQGRMAASDIVLGVMYLLAVAVILVNNRNNNALFYSMLCLLGAILSILAWTHHRSLVGVIPGGVFSLIYASSAWQAHKKTRADKDLPSASLAALGQKNND